MLVTLIRALILYVVIMLAVRLMGKRQIGELQPSELIITILLSEMIAIPLQDNDLPLLNSVVPAMVLISIEVVSSVIAMKSKRFRAAVQGNPVVVIRDGVIDQRQIRQLRFTVDDLFLSLRQKDVFDIAQVDYAILETNGSLSVLLKPSLRAVTPQDLQLKTAQDGVPYLVISDGKIIRSALRLCGITEKQLHTRLRAQAVRVEDVFLMTLDRGGNIYLAKKERQA